MENDSNQTVNKAAYANNSSLLTKNIYISLIIAIVIGLVIGFFASRLFSKSGVQEQKQAPASITHSIPPVKNTDPRLLLDPVETLKSPIFTEWGGSVEGKIIKKDEDSITIEKSGRDLQIFNQESLTGYYKESSASANFPQKIAFNEVNVGDMIRGGVTISRNTMDNNPDHHIFANVLTVIEQNDQAK